MFLRDRAKADSVLDTLLDPNQLDMGEIRPMPTTPYCLNHSLIQPAFSLDGAAESAECSRRQELAWPAIRSRNQGRMWTSFGSKKASNAGSRAHNGLDFPKICGV